MLNVFTAKEPGDAPKGNGAYDTILVSTKGKVGIITLNRPHALNALNAELIGEVNRALDGFEADSGIGCIVITGNDKAFAAGVDIKEMHQKTFVEAYGSDFLAPFDRISNCRKPIIAAVGGYALGGGCELAMACDIILAADTAVFGQPEITLGIMPGNGGTQRLTRAVGKAKAMELCLTGRRIKAEEAERSNLVSRVVPAADLMDRGDEGRRQDRQSLAARGDDDQGSDQSRLCHHARRRCALRARPVLLAVRDRGPERGHGSVHREAHAGVHQPLGLSPFRLLGWRGFRGHLACVHRRRCGVGFGRPRHGVGRVVRGSRGAALLILAPEPRGVGDHRLLS